MKWDKGRKRKKGKEVRRENGKEGYREKGNMDWVIVPILKRQFLL
jgi:hypothetical protein